MQANEALMTDHDRINDIRANRSLSASMRYQEDVLVLLQYIDELEAEVDNLHRHIGRARHYLTFECERYDNCDLKRVSNQRRSGGE